MEHKKKIWLQATFLVLVAGLTIYAILRGQDIPTLIDSIQTADPWYIALSFIFVAVFIMGESMILWYLLKTWGIRVPLLRCYLYSGVGFFFSCITPSATGGQPAQIYHMKKDKIPIPVATVILMIVTITYKLVLVAVGLAVLIFRPERVMPRLEPVLFLCYLGLALNVVCVVFMCFLVFHPVLAERILMVVLGLMQKMKFFRKKGLIERGRKAMEQYRQTAVYLAEHHGAIAKVFLISVAQRFILFAVTALVYRAFGLSGERMIDLLLLSAMISVAVDMLPLPGGMGISEGMFYKIFLPIFGTQLTIPAMLVSRGISYYGQLIISAILTVLATVLIGKKAKGIKGD